MIDDILQLVTEIIVIVEGETGVPVQTDWSGLQENQKEQLVDALLDQAFKNSITGPAAGDITPSELFGKLITKYELNDDYATWQQANQWFKSHIPPFEATYKIKFNEKYTGSLLQGGPAALYGWFKKNWVTLFIIVAASVAAIIFLPKYLKKL